MTTSSSPRAQALEVYGDAVPGDRLSDIALLKRLVLPPAALCGDDDTIVGIAMTYDGRVAFATSNGVVGIAPREPDLLTAESLRVTNLNGSACGTDAELETISNSIAADEDDGLYVVTSDAQYRFDTGPASAGGTLPVVWRGEYELGEDGGGARLGAGSGSTPSLMGTDDGDDRFVVITDGQELMHVTFFWRDEIPSDWQPIAPGKDRRIACEVPVTFGDPDAQESLSEQSVLVRGNATVVVNNELFFDAAFAPLPPELRPFSILSAQVPGNAPQGVERIDWDPATRTCGSVWANPDVSIPNGIPSMSAETGLFYGIGLKDGTTWGLQALDFETGDEAFFAPADATPFENSFFAMTVVGPDADVWTGTAGNAGVPGAAWSVYRSAAVDEPEPVVPEAPLVLLLPLAGGAALLLARRRAGARAA